MADLNIPNLNKKSGKYIFKKKLSLRRKPKKRLFIESVLMFISGLFLIYINYLIPNKSSLLQNVPTALNRIFLLIIDLFSNLSDVFLVLFIFISYLVTLILFIGIFNRIVRIASRKTRIINYK
ncbi:nucleoside-diphosphate kinase [Prochlorococcus marinus]|uniref:nucleoside-diphosphate kinase n=1 Tax=Prochlorococcus marinus TaxID=1219 RepID=UPI001AD9D94A|nr:nucleoside-diphosphate kinase [Prochlorococcus marinus]MBO8221050.1 nucleoside-diphosphate kinase [Prochlorococcus marinus CUG1417]MBW3075662.1 nucleoside-diphosphate kinase [Prochlorococcus marinus str. MU1417]